MYQRHDHPTCPPPEVVTDDDNKTRKVRPEHRCQGRWVGVLDFGWSGGKRRRRIVYGATKGAVQTKLRKLRESPATAAPTGNGHTVESWMTYWLTDIAAEQIRPQTMQSYRSKIDRYIIPLLGRHKLERLEPRHAREMYKELRARGLSEATLRQTHAILSRALKIATREELVTRNVATLVEPPSTHTASRTPLTVVQARQVLEAAKGDPFESRWYAALCLGLRQGEALGLAWANVNLDEAVMIIDRTLILENNRPAFGVPKSDASRRAVPIPTPVLSRLKVHWGRYVEACRTKDREPDISSLVWCQPDGKPLHRKSDYNRWRDLLDKASVPQVPLHVARNTSAHLLESAGVPVRLAAEILGHSEVSMTYRYQLGASVDVHREALDSLGELLD